MTRLIIDCNLTLDEALAGREVPILVRGRLVILRVLYYSDDGLLHQGQIVVHEAIASEVTQIFEELRMLNFRIHSVIPIVVFDWDDQRSMAANNSHSYNPRLIAHVEPPRFSLHSYGLPIDLNPKQNPCDDRDGKRYPPGSVYDVTVPGTFVHGGAALNVFLKRKWECGLYWKDLVDRHHFQPNVAVELL